MGFSRSAYPPMAARLNGVDRNADNGWGGYQWTEAGTRRVPARLLGYAEYGDLRMQIRVELVELTQVMWQIAEAMGYKIWTANPNKASEDWGPWGYEDRPISGTKVASNHSRARAEDDNAPWNPMSTQFISTVPPQYVTYREQCGFYWGGRYTGTADTMHWEYVGKPSDVPADLDRARAILRNLRGIPSPSVPDNTEEDWFDMASRDDLKAVIREVLDERAVTTDSHLDLLNPRTVDIFNMTSEALGIVRDNKDRWAAEGK